MRLAKQWVVGILIVSASLLAQRNAPPSAVNPPASSAVEATDNAAASPATLGPLEVLTDTMGVDFNPYLARVLHDVKQNWYALIQESASWKKGRVVLEFYIMKDGSVAGLKVVGSSGDVAMDRPAYGSITGSNPLPPLPIEFTGPYLGLRFSYYYNLGLTDMALTRTVQDVQRKLHENFINDKNAKTDLEHDCAALTKLLDAGSLNAMDDAGARYSRALAQNLLDVLRKWDGLPPDTVAAEQALSDLDRIIAGKSDILAWGITIPQVEYFAGEIARIGLRSDSRANSYWKLCADTAHAGCIFYLADAYTVGLGGLQADPTKALDLDLKVFETGTKYTCAGARAASAIAELIYFTGTQYPKDNDPVSWMQKSYALSDQIEATPNRKDSCAGSAARIDEFLFRLGRGDRQNELLSQAAQHLGDDSTASAALINYFSGSLDAKGFTATVESSKWDGGRCFAYFHAMWYAYLNKNTALVNQFYEPLLKFDPHTCPADLIFAKKFRSESSQVQPLAQK